MSGEEDVTRGSIDRDLHAALNVEPSPEFVARVRVRIANEPARAPWRFVWLSIPAAAVAIVAVAAVVWMIRPGQHDGPASIERPAIARGPIAAPPVVAPAAPDATPPHPPLARGERPTAAKRPARLRTPEVLVPAGEVEALRRVIASLRDGPLPVVVLRVEVPPTPRDIEPSPDITIAPLHIEPLLSESVKSGQGVQP